MANQSNLNKQETTKIQVVNSFAVDRSGHADNKIYFSDWIPGVPLRIAGYSLARSRNTFRYFNVSTGIWMIAKDIGPDDVYTYE